MALTDKLSAIGDAIRAKTGKSGLLTLEQMPGEIAGIAGGGGGASADVRYVTFMNGNTVLYKKPVAVGDDCVDVLTKGLIETPTKENTAQYSYTYCGWGASDGGDVDADIFKNITEDKTVYAIYTATVRTYTVTYYDNDGTTVLKTETLAYGVRPSYVPIKTDHEFVEWTPAITSVTGDASYVASWVKTEIPIIIPTQTLSYTLNTYGHYAQINGLSEGIEDGVTYRVTFTGHANSNYDGAKTYTKATYYMLWGTAYTNTATGIGNPWAWDNHSSTTRNIQAVKLNDYTGASVYNTNYDYWITSGYSSENNYYWWRIFTRAGDTRTHTIKVERMP